eukprot:263243_1
MSSPPQTMMNNIRMHRTEIRRMCAWLYGFYLIITILISLQFYYQIHFMLHGLLIFVPFAVIGLQLQQPISLHHINQFHLDKKLQNELLCIGAFHLIFNNCFYYFNCSEQHNSLIVFQFIVTLAYLLLLMFQIISESLAPPKTPNQNPHKRSMIQQIKMKSKQEHKQKRNKPNTNTRQSKRQHKELQQKCEKMSKKYETIQVLLQRKSSTFDTLRAKLTKSHHKNAKLKDEINSLKLKISQIKQQNAIEHKQTTAQMNQMRDKYDTKHDILTVCKDENKGLKTQIDGLKLEMKQFKQIKHKYKERMNEFETKYDTNQQLIAIYKEKNDALNDENNALKERMTRIETESKQMEIKMRDVVQANKYYQDVLSTMTAIKNETETATKCIEKEEKMSAEELNVLVCKQRGWKAVICDINRRSFAGFKRNPFSQTELNQWWQWMSTSNQIEWNRPNGFPRECAWFVSSECQCCYRYSNTLWRPNVFPEWFNAMTQRVLDQTGLHFEYPPNSCNVNWYNDGTDSVGWHSDDEALFDSSRQDTLIISLSLGQHRRFEVKLKDDDKESDLSDEIKDIVLYSGDLMTMEGLFQKHYLHRVPKQYDIANCKARINCTWRWIKNHYKNRDQCNATQSGPGRVGQNNKNV